MTGFVYMWMNNITARYYIGSHRGTPDDGYIGSGNGFNKAVKKHGIENFTRRILYQGPLYKDVEEWLLQTANGAGDADCYNQRNTYRGGSHPGGGPSTKFKPGRVPWNKGLKGAQVAWNKGLPKDQQPRFGEKREPHTAETRAKISASKMGTPAPNKGIPCSEETKAKLREAGKRQIPHKQTPETITKILETRRRNKAAKLALQLHESADTLNIG